MESLSNFFHSLRALEYCPDFFSFSKEFEPDSFENEQDSLGNEQDSLWNEKKKPFWNPQGDSLWNEALTDRNELADLQMKQARISF